MTQRPWLQLLAVAVLITGLSQGADRAGAADQLAEFEKRIATELETESPEAARLFAEADIARQRGDSEAAARLYAQVYEKVPTFVHALRRQCQTVLAEGEVETAIDLCRGAVEQEPTAENLAALALALSADRQGARPPGADLEEAARLAARAIDLAPQSFYAQTTLCRVAVDRGDIDLLRRCTSRMQASFPEELGTMFYRAILAGGEERFDDAEAELARARAAGLPEEAYRAMLDQVRTVRPEEKAAVNGVPGWLLPAAGVWIGGFLVLLAAGWVLSGAALRAARQVPAALEGGVRGFDALLRRVYQVVLWLCCGYYWVSIPILFVLVAALGGGAVYGILNLGHIPLMLLATIVLGTLGTLWAIVRSLFVRGSREDPGERLDLGRYAGLRGMLDEVAERVGTRPVDNVYLTPGTEVAVMERGRGLLARARGLIAGGGPARERCLILGAGVLEGMRLGPLKAVLAHEYGHFSNRDTAGGGFALAVRRSLVVMGQALARRGAAWYNPAWLFVNGFYRIFLRISQGASRLQEVLADRWAALLYGSRAFEQGLRHVVEQSVRFDAHAGATVNEVVMEKRELPNLYAYRPTVAPAEAEVDRAVQQAVAAPPSPYDSHPSPADRMAWVRALAAPGAGASQDDERPAWTLFPDRDAIERRMTAAIRDNIRAAHGIAIPAAGGS